MKSQAMLPESSNSSITLGLTELEAPICSGALEMVVSAANALSATDRPVRTKLMRAKVFIAAPAGSKRDKGLSQGRRIARSRDLNRDPVEVLRQAVEDQDRKSVV